MKILRLYIASTILYTSIITILGLTAVFCLFTYISNSVDIGKGSFTAFTSLLYVLYKVPANIYLIMPVCGLFGSLMGLNLLTTHSELIVIRSSGQSTIEIAKGVLLAAFILAIITFLIGAYMAPYYQKYAAITKALVTKNENHEVSTANTQELWIHHEDDSSFIYIKKNHTTGSLNDITQYIINNNQLVTINHADGAIFDNEKWQATKVSNINIGETNIYTKHYDKQYLETSVSPFLLKILTSNIDHLNLNELIYYLKNNKDYQGNLDRIWLKFWQTFFHPISLIILMLIAIPFSLGSPRSFMLGYKFIVGIIFGFSFYIINQSFGNLSIVYNFSGFLGAIIPNVVFLVILCLLFWKVHE